MERLDLTIAGMHCSHCVGRVTKALEQLPGVEVVKVGIGAATVRFDPAAQSADAIAQAVTATGYAARAA
jgi:copper chaperone CopZ